MIAAHKNKQQNESELIQHLDDGWSISNEVRGSETCGCSGDECMLMIHMLGM